MATREAFLQRVRQAVREGNRHDPACHTTPNETAPALPRRGTTGYQGAGTNPIERFCTELAGAGGVAHVVSSHEAALAKIREIIDAKGARKILVGADPVVDDLDLAARLEELGLECSRIGMLTASNSRESFFAADIGVSGVAHLIAETGTLVITSAPHHPRSISLLPPVHIAVATRSQILPDLFDLFDLFSPLEESNGSANGQTHELPSNLSLITGPSKTGDIELKLVTGVHGPGELHVVLGTW